MSNFDGTRGEPSIPLHPVFSAENDRILQKSGAFRGGFLESLITGTDNIQERKNIFDTLRLRLADLCKSHHTWLAGGKMYLENEGGRLVCKDIETNEEAIILWQGEEYVLEFDTENRSQRELWRLPAELHFKMRRKGRDQQEVFYGAQVTRTTPEMLLHLLSEKSMELAEVPFEERMKHRQPNGDLGAAQRIIFGNRQKRQEHEHIMPHTITLMMNNDSRSKISYDKAKDLSFVDIKNGDRLYPDFSSIYEGNIVRRHGREYIEANCWNTQTNRQKEHLLSRPEGFGNFEKYYLQVGSNKFEVMHLVGHTQAQIKFLDGDYRVDVDDEGNMKSKQQRYISLSGASTFWYDLREHKKLDHEPA